MNKEEFIDFLNKNYSKALVKKILDYGIDRNGELKRILNSDDMFTKLEKKQIIESLNKEIYPEYSYSDDILNIRKKRNNKNYGLYEAQNDVGELEINTLPLKLQTILNLKKIGITKINDLLDKLYVEKKDFDSNNNEIVFITVNEALQELVELNTIRLLLKDFGLICKNDPNYILRYEFDNEKKYDLRLLDITSATYHFLSKRFNTINELLCVSKEELSETLMNNHVRYNETINIIHGLKMVFSFEKYVDDKEITEKSYYY